MGQEYWYLKAWFVVCENYMFSVLGCLLHWYMVQKYYLPWLLQGPAGAAGLPGEVGLAGPPVSTAVFAENTGLFN